MLVAGFREDFEALDSLYTVCSICGRTSYTLFDPLALSAVRCAAEASGSDTSLDDSTTCDGDQYTDFRKPDTNVWVLEALTTVWLTIAVVTSIGLFFEQKTVLLLSFGLCRPAFNSWGFSCTAISDTF